MNKLSIDRSKPHPRAEQAGFTFIELLVVITIIALLGALLAPAMASGGADSAAAKCMNNLRQVMVAWQMYTDDNRSIFPYNQEGGAPPAWVSGQENYSGGTDPVGCNTNPAVLLTDTAPIAYAQIGPYIKSVEVFRCPLDPSRNHGTTGAPRLRSISMSQSIGYGADGTAAGQGNWLPSHAVGGPWSCYFKQSDLSRPSPAGLFVILEENPDTINDAAFAFQMPVVASTEWIDWPAKYHDNGCNFAFADGHVETHKWQMPQALPNVTLQSNIYFPPTVPNNPDVFWIANRASARFDGGPNGFPSF